jgi:hypothetical protein
MFPTSPSESIIASTWDSARRTRAGRLPVPGEVSGSWATAAFFFGAIPCVLSGLAVLFSRKHPHVIDPVHHTASDRDAEWVDQD